MSFFPERKLPERKANQPEAAGIPQGKQAGCKADNSVADSSAKMKNEPIPIHMRKIIKPAGKTRPGLRPGIGRTGSLQAVNLT